MTTVARNLQDELKVQGAEWFVGFPGESTLAWYAAAQQAGRAHVCARCERCAGFMADAYARVSRALPVVDSPGGIGSPYLVPALHEALNSAVPLVAMVTDARADPHAAWRTATCDNERMLGAVSKAVIRLEQAEDVAACAARCVRTAREGRPGPVTLLVDDGLLDAPAVTTVRPSPDPDARPSAVDPDLIGEVAARLAAARRPLLVCGGGVHSAHAYDEVRVVAERFGAAIAVTFNGLGAVAADEPAYIGPVGAKGHPESNRYASEADVVVWLGSKRGDKSTQYGALPGKGSWSAVVDIDERTPGREPTADLHLTAHIRDVLSALSTVPVGPITRTRVNRPALPAPAEGTPGWLIEQAGRQLPAETTVVADASKASSWVGAYLAPRRPGRSIIAPRGSGAIGWGLPAALGAAVARPDAPVLAVVGDGGFLMAAHELETAARLGLNVAVLVLNNHRLELLDQVGRDRYGDRFGLPESRSDLSALARSLGTPADDADDGAAALKSILATFDSGGPRLINFRMPSFSVSPDLAMHRGRTGARQW